ncbi:hypothetical protein NC796_26060 [Aliifodinibius sp. S!AR15-10]|uniref:hypothetical protein n=1 Tax=Aliifodinibius sp. S!AR15-10 TaxID=2950437 RepID=UPI002862AC55|nr:hypothetical protein [Aliifodinibius sp. S!AR15-10]MDR8394636.1 hypothetical protein [Aliifodinibius sp. S!AR15-10]
MAVIQQPAEQKQSLKRAKEWMPFFSPKRSNKRRYKTTTKRDGPAPRSLTVAAVNRIGNARPAGKPAVPGKPIPVQSPGYAAGRARQATGCRRARTVGALSR